MNDMTFQPGQSRRGLSRDITNVPTRESFGKVNSIHTIQSNARLTTSTNKGNDTISGGGHTREEDSMAQQSAQTDPLKLKNAMSLQVD